VAADCLAEEFDIPGMAVEFAQPGREGAQIRDAIQVIRATAGDGGALTATRTAAASAARNTCTVRVSVAGFLSALVRWPADRGVIAETLAWLWDAIAIPLLPVLTAACAAADGPRPRVWWCPTGPLTFLPLHAAGHHDGSGDSILDRFISSYTPTLRLLLRTRTHVGPARENGRHLAVALPDTPGLSPIPNATVEADDFASRFGHVIQLRDSSATAAAVRQALEQSPPLAHFACHGTQDVTSPSAGYLRLHNGPLSIPEITGLRLDGAELAFLSACETSLRQGAPWLWASYVHIGP